MFNGESLVKAPASAASFGIGAVSRLTGIPMDTLRVWERRYHVVTPRRSAQNRRLYSREDVTRLLLIKQLVEQGEPVGSVVHLTLAELHDQTRAHAELRLQTQAGAAANPGTAQRAATLLVYGDALPYQVEQWALDLPEFDLLGAHAEFADFASAAAAIHPEILLMEFPALQPAVLGRVRQLLRQGEFQRSIVVYTFAAGNVLERLHSMGVLTLRAPVGARALREACRGGADEAGSQPIEIPPQSGLSGIPPRRYSGKQLATIAQANTRLQCECSLHVVDLLARLGAFEDYSAGCESVIEMDAAAHARLHEATARARAVLEDALEGLMASGAVDFPNPAEPPGTTGSEAGHARA